MAEIKKYHGKYFSVMGDSISTFEGVSPSWYNIFYTAERKCEADILTSDNTWWGIVIDRLGGKLLVDNAWSGSLVSKLPQCEIESYGASDERTEFLGTDEISPDVVMVYIGTNDWGWDVPIDPPVGHEEDVGFFLSAYTVMLRKIRRNYPDAEIWCFTLTNSDRMLDSNFSLPFTKNGRPFAEYCRAIRECANQEGCKLIDIYRTDKGYRTIDGLHPDAEGMRQIADLVLDVLQE